MSTELKKGFINRDRKQIIGLIIALIKENPDIRRTKLQFLSYVSSEQMVYFIKEMEKCDLLKTTKDDEGKIASFQVTPKGDRYLEIWTELNKLLNT